MNHYKDLDTLYDFLKSITSIEEFFEKKEPDFGDNVSRNYAEWAISNGDDPEHILSALKANERARYAEARKEREKPH